MDNLELVISPISNKIYLKDLNTTELVDITEDFKRCVVMYCSESIEFKVDGMKFRATCERIE